MSFTVWKNQVAVMASNFRCLLMLGSGWNTKNAKGKSCTPWSLTLTGLDYLKGLFNFHSLLTSSLLSKAKSLLPLETILANITYNYKNINAASSTILSCRLPRTPDDPSTSLQDNPAAWSRAASAILFCMSGPCYDTIVKRAAAIANGEKTFSKINFH